MKNILVILCSVAIVLSSCQKEPSFEDPNSIPGGGGTGGGTTGNKLVRIGTRFGADTVTTNYTYNNSNLLTKFQQSGIISGTSITAEVRYVRNAANRITSSIVKNDALAQFGLDSIESFHTYDVANSRYKYSIIPITILGSTETDSIVYIYASGKLTSSIDYYNDGTGYIPYSKEEYAYVGSNLLEVKSYSFNDMTSSYELDETKTYEYDTKTNPTQFAADAQLMSMDLFYSANNETKRTTTQTGSPAVVVNTSYTYNAGNRPLTAVTTSGGATTSTSNYTYQ